MCLIKSATYCTIQIEIIFNLDFSHHKSHTISNIKGNNKLIIVKCIILDNLLNL
jgi:hypothetical protein